MGTGLSKNPFIEKYNRQREPLPDTPEGMLNLLSTLSDEELQEMMAAQKELEKRLDEFLAPPTHFLTPMQ